MEILNPNEIGVRIASMILESKKRFIAVSPYVKVSEWKKMTYAIGSALERGVKIELYYREMNEKEYNYLNSVGVHLIEVPDLHTKLYMNENCALSGSMNLYMTSDLYSKELGFYFENFVHYDKLYDYFKKHIESSVLGGEVDETVKDLAVLKIYLEREFVDSKINDGSGYLYCKNLFGDIDVMIDLNRITLKLWKRDPEPSDYEDYSRAFDQITDFKVTERLVELTYNYVYWDVDIKNYSFLQIHRVLDKLIEEYQTSRN